MRCDEDVHAQTVSGDTDGTAATNTASNPSNDIPKERRVMTELFASPAGIADYGATAHAMAGEVAAAGTTAAGTALIGAAFGLIGADFVAAFATAQANHAQALAALAHTAAALGDASLASAANYRRTDVAHASAIEEARA